MIIFISSVYQYWQPKFCQKHEKSKSVSKMIQQNKNNFHKGKGVKMEVVYNNMRMRAIVLLFFFGICSFLF